MTNDQTAEQGRQTLLRRLRDYQARWPDEPAGQRFIEFVERQPQCFERATLEGHVTASALVVDVTGLQVLLLHHRKLDRWLQPGGHADGDPDTLAVARREVEEEVGLTELTVVGGILDLDIHPIPARPGEPEHLHYDVRYVLQAKPEQAVRGNHESLAQRWFGINELLAWSEESIARMARKWRGGHT